MAFATGESMTNRNPRATAAPPWHPSDLPTLRAAYSDRTASLMAYLAAYAYDARVETQPPTISPEISNAGFEKITSFHNGYTDGWACVLEGKDIIVLAFRGTVSKKNWHTNFQAALVHPENTDAQLRVHEGFYKAFSKLSDGSKGIEQKIAEIKQATQGQIPIYIVGHSLGGALAQISAAVIGNDQIAACYTFGSPRVGNSLFDLWVKPPSYRLVNYADIVPQVPLPFIYRHSGDPRYMPDAMTNSPYRFQPGLFQRLWQIIRGIIQFARSGSILGIEDHAIDEYCRKLDAIARFRSQSR
jgi:triacylglycerol lipase